MVLLAVLTAFLLAATPPPSAVAATDHVVGGSIWSIPPSSDLYRVWASNRTFVVGDNLIFRFDMGLYNVVQVGRRQYEDCSAEDPYNTFNAAPAVVHLDFAGVRYFTCTVGNYCALGVKIYVQLALPLVPVGAATSFRRLRSSLLPMPVLRPAARPRRHSPVTFAHPCRRSLRPTLRVCSPGLGNFEVQHGYHS